MLIDSSIINKIKAEAEHSPRRRMNFCLHEDFFSNAQKMLNYFLPDTVVPIHRHQTKNETYIIISGKVEVIFTNDHKEVCNTFILNRENGVYGIDIPKGQWHTIKVKEPSLIFECSDGPYIPLLEEDILGSL